MQRRAASEIIRRGNDPPRLHVLFRKEDVEEDRIRGCVAVVIDVLLATTTIAAALGHGAKEVIPVLNGDEAIAWSRRLPPGSFVLAGEKDGYTLQGFVSPSPLEVVPKAKGKTLIFSTTNGTVAVRRSSSAEAVYTASLLNARAVAQRLLERHREQTVVLVCSGSQGTFALEDFYGAGRLLDLLAGDARFAWDWTDAALAAWGYYQNYPESGAHCLARSRVGRFLSGLGYAAANAYAAQTDILPVVPRLQNGRLVI
jgi:2-phosphosulfolactate phosphatase